MSLAGGYIINSFTLWRKKVLETQNILPIYFGMQQEDIIAEFGQPDDTSTMMEKGRPLIFKYEDIEFHFDARLGHTLFLIYSDDELDLCIMDESKK